MKTATRLSLLLTLITLPILSHATTYTYDELNRVTRVTYSNGDYVAYNYDAAGNITQIVSSARNGHQAQNATATPKNTTVATHTEQKKPAAVQQVAKKADAKPVNHPVASSQVLAKAEPVKVPGQN